MTEISILILNFSNYHNMFGVALSTLLLLGRIIAGRGEKQFFGKELTKIDGKE